MAFTLLHCKVNHRHFCAADFRSFLDDIGSMGVLKTSEVLIYNLIIGFLAK